MLEAGDTIIDGGNSDYRDDMRHARPSWRSARSDFVDCGTSGGVFGLERGYCLMIGGPDAVVDRLDPIWDTLAPGRRLRPSARPGATVTSSPAERGYLHCGPVGAGHFVKMVHNGIEYGLMAAYAEGLNILRNADAGSRRARGGRGDGAAGAPRVLPVRIDLPDGRRGLAPRQRDRLVAARPDRHRPAPIARARDVRGPRLRLRARAGGRRSRRSRRACRYRF